MIRIAICDDYMKLAEEVKHLINNSCLKEQYSIEIFTTGVELLNKVKNSNYVCNILFMDIELENNRKGTDIALALKKIHPDMLIIYISAYNNYYEAMVQAEPFRFLSKPLHEEKLKEVLQAAIKRLKKYEYTYRYDREVYIVDLKEVVYFYSEDKKIYMHLKNGEESFFNSKLDVVEGEVEKICDMFIRINKSYIININCLHKFRNNKIFVKDNNEIIEFNVSRNYKDKLTEWYINSLIEKFN